MLLVVLVGLVLVSCGGGESTDTTSRVVAATTSAPTTSSPSTTAPATTTTSVTMFEEPGGAKVESDVEYATHNGVPLTLDLYFPAEPLGAPVLVTEGFKEVDHLVDEGVLVVHVNEEPDSAGVPPAGPDQHMLDNRVPFRTTTEMFACAVRFAREQAAELGASDPTVALMSLSLGGGFFAHVALFGADFEAAWDEFATAGGPPRQIECAATGGSTDVDGLIGVAGAYDFLVPIYEGLYGLSHQQEQDPEFQAFLASAVGRNPDLKVRLFHDPADGAIPLENSTMFHEALAEAGYDVELITFDGGHDYPPAELIVPALTEVLGR